MKKQTRKLLVSVGTFVLALGVVLGLAAPAQASAPVVLAGSGWSNGSGVNVCSASTDPNCGSEAHVGGWSADWWQCVELAQRFYKKQGWYSGIFPGVDYAYQIYNNASGLGMSRQANGSIASIIPGDMIVHASTDPGSGGAGHVAIVDSISGSTVNVVEQNGPTSNGRASYTLSNGTLVRGSAPILGIVHSPANNSGSTSGQSYTAPNDYNNDGYTDIGVFRPSDAGWHIWTITDFYYGESGDILVPGSYNGVGVQPAVFRPSTGYWHIRGGDSINYGQAGDIPVPADYNNDGITDIAVFRPSTGEWHIRGIDDFAYGEAGDIPVPGDYDGNGTIEAAVFRPSTGFWYVRGGASVNYGQSGDIPQAFDWNNDGKTDMGIYRPSDGGWHIRLVGDFMFGEPGDIPVAGNYYGDANVEAAVYRPSNQYWYIRGGASINFGEPGDVPVPVIFKK